MIIQLFSTARDGMKILLFLALILAGSTQAAPTAPDSACLAEIDAAQARMTEFNQLYERCRAAGILLDYPAVAKTMLEQFIPLGRKDAEGADVGRARFEAKDFRRTLDESIAAMKAYLNDPSLALNVRRFQTGKVKSEA